MAQHHDTSTEKIETTYAAYLPHHTDDITRPTLIDLWRSNVVSLRGEVA